MSARIALFALVLVACGPDKTMTAPAPCGSECHDFSNSAASACRAGCEDSRSATSNPRYLAIVGPSCARQADMAPPPEEGALGRELDRDECVATIRACRTACFVSERKCDVCLRRALADHSREGT